MDHIICVTKNRLIHASLQLAHRDFVFFDDVHGCSPAWNSIAIECVKHCLRNCLKEILRLQIRTPQCFAHSKKLLLAGSSNAKIFRLANTSDEIHVANEGLECCGIQTGNYRFNEVRPKAMFVKELGHNCSVSLWLHRSVLADFVKILAELKTLEDSDDIGLEASQAQV